MLSKPQLFSSDLSVTLNILCTRSQSEARYNLRKRLKNASASTIFLDIYSIRLSYHTIASTHTQSRHPLTTALKIIISKYVYLDLLTRHVNLACYIFLPDHNVEKCGWIYAVTVYLLDFTFYCLLEFLQFLYLSFIHGGEGVEIQKSPTSIWQEYFASLSL